MAKERLSMRKTKEILRLRWSQGLSVRETARSVGVSTGVIDKAACRARAAGLTWAEIDVLPEAELEAKLYGVGPVTAGVARAQPDPVYMHQELMRVGVTLELLHLEYLQEHPEGYRYTSFCEVYRRWRARKPMWMRQSHKAGEKAFTDYSGKRPQFVDPTTGESDRGRAVRRRARCVELHVRGGDSHAAHRRLARLAQSDGRVLRRRDDDGRARSTEVGGDDAVSVRAGHHAVVRAMGDSLRHRDRAGASAQAKRQGEGRSRCAGRTTLGARAPAQRNVLLARGAQRANCGAARGSECAADACVRRREPARSVRTPRQASAPRSARDSDSRSQRGATPP